MAERTADVVVRLRRSRRLTGLLAGATVAATLAFIWLPRIGGPSRTAILAVAVVVHLALVLGRPDRSALPPLAVLALTAGLVVGAAAAAPEGTDLWAYQMYGRTVVEHDASPYVHPPQDFPDDPVLERMQGNWVGTRAEYGPVLVGTAAVVATVTGTNELAGRLAWQGLCGGAVLGAVLLLMRRTGSAVAMAMVGLNPLVIYQLVNLAHNDALIGVLVLGAVIAADDERDVGAALLLTAAALIKAPTGIGLIALLLWIGHRRGWWAAARAALVAGLAGGVALLAVGGTEAVEPMLGARGRANGFTPWNLFRGGTALFRGDSMLDLPLGVTETVATWALVVSTVVALAVAAARTWRPSARLDTGVVDAEPGVGPAGRTAGAAAVVGAALVAWTLLSLYTSPWSFGWVLPVLALVHRSWLSRAVTAYAGLFAVVAHWGIVTIAAAWLQQPEAAAYDDISALMKSVLLLGLLAILAVLVGDALWRVRGGSLSPAGQGAPGSPSVRAASQSGQMTGGLGRATMPRSWSNRSKPS